MPDMPELMVDLHGVDPILAARLLAFSHAACRWLGRHYLPDCCIAATRLALCVLRDRLHMKVRPLPIMTAAANAAFIRLFNAEGPPDEATQARWAQEVAWVVILGETDQEPEPGHWRGHLAALVNDSVLIDLSAGQAYRPAKSIHVGPFLPTVPPGFPSGQVLGRRPLPEGGSLQIEAIPDNHTYQRSPDWQRTQRYDAATRYILDEMKHTLPPHTKRRR
jgi:hypothetical protein